MIDVEMETDIEGYSDDGLKSIEIEIRRFTWRGYTTHGRSDENIALYSIIK